MKFLNLTILLSLLTIVGCASQNKSVALGGAIGAGSGAAIGGIVDPGQNGKYRTRNIIIGSAVGGIAGMVAGSTIFNSNEEKKKEAYEKGQKEAKDAFAKQGNMPGLKNPKVEARWIDGRVVGNRYIDGHFEYIIVEQAKWDVE